MDKKKLLSFFIDALIVIILFCVFSGVFFFLAAVVSAILSPFIHSDAIDSLLILFSFVMASVVTFKVVGFLKKYDPISSGSQFEHSNSAQAGLKESTTNSPCLDSDSQISIYVYRDILFPDAVEIVLETSIVSAGRLQSTLQIGSIRATNLLTEMEEQGIIGPSRGNRPREIFISQEEWYRSVKKYVPPSPTATDNQEPITLFCTYCGKKVVVGSKYCPSCGKQTNSTPGTFGDLQVDVAPKNSVHGNSKKKCPRCRGRNITHETVVESNSSGCFTCLVYIILALTIFGLLIIIPLMLRSKTKTVTYAICQDCGHRWRSY